MSAVKFCLLDMTWILHELILSVVNFKRYVQDQASQNSKKVGK